MAQTSATQTAAHGAFGGARTMSFYMYRAQGDKLYSPRNVNLADLPGVMWYLHNEVVKESPRKFGITRIIRYRVTVRTTNFSLASTGSQFGPFVAYDYGKCTVPDCANLQRKTGYVVGCAIPRWAGHGNYVSLATYPCRPPHCKEPTWYSLPGEGGNCPIDDQKVTVGEVPPVTGAPGCTYFAKYAGEIPLNTLINIPPGQPAYHAWLQRGSKEYDEAADRGICPGGTCSFWSGRNDQAKCAQRQRIIMNLFDKKYPAYPKTFELGDSPPCADLRPITFP